VRNAAFGLTVQDSASAVITRNTIDESLGGLVMLGTTTSRLVSNSVTDTSVSAIHMTGSTKNVLSGNKIARDGFFGLFLQIGSQDNLVRHNSITDASIWDIDVPRNRFIGNSLRGTTGGILLTGGSSDSIVSDNEIVPDEPVTGAGARIYAHADRNRIERNTVRNSAISIDGTDNLVLANSLSGVDNGGFDIAGRRNLVSENEVRDATWAITLDGGSENVLRANTVLDSGEYGIALGNGFPGDTGNLLLDNRVVGSGVDGIRVPLFQDGQGFYFTETTIRGNVVKRNGDDGIDVHIPSATIAANRADFNGDLGIEAVEGVTDGGGNQASGYGNPLQCLNVFCR
jgi:parallel beta-helix repeat protein